MVAASPEKRARARAAPPTRSPVAAAVRWYLATQGTAPALPFYCDRARVGSFAVAPDALAAGEEPALFQLFVALSMYQALRDVVIMRQQRELPRTKLRVVADLGRVRRAITKHACPALQTSTTFARCDVSKRGAVVDCATCPGVACPVKDATVVFHRMGDMGKLPTSAWLLVWKDGGARQVLADVCRQEVSPARRASLLVDRFAKVHRVGRKLATMFVSALSTPALAPGLTPWFPAVDGNELVVVDTNVARAADALRPPRAPKTYDARERWVREQAASIDLRKLRADFPRGSPRIVQQALYAFCSKSNRVAAGDACVGRTTPCAGCAPSLCPFTQTLTAACRPD